MGWIFIDLGGVLIEEDALHRAIYDHVFELLNRRCRPIGRDEFQAALDRAAASDWPFTTKGLMRALAGDTPGERAAYEEYRTAIPRIFAETCTVHPRAAEVLDALSRTHRLAAVANQPKVTRNLLERSGIVKKLEFVILSEEMGVSKPDPAIFRLALERAGTTARESIYIGDRIDNDVIPARALGFRTVRLRVGMFSVQEPRGEAERPDAEAASLEELPAAVAGLSRR